MTIIMLPVYDGSEICILGSLDKSNNLVSMIFIISLICKIIYFNIVNFTAIKAFASDNSVILSFKGLPGLDLRCYVYTA